VSGIVSSNAKAVQEPGFSGARLTHDTDHLSSALLSLGQNIQYRCQISISSYEFTERALTQTAQG